MNQIVGGLFAQHRMRGVRVADGFAKLAAKTSEDGQWLTGIVIDTAESSSFNF